MEKQKEKKLKLTTRRIIVLIIAAIILCLLIFGIVKLFSTVFAKEVVYGNLSNKGLAVADGGTVFYNKYDTGIVKLKGGKEYQITDENAYCITLYNGKLYYLTISNENTIYLMSVDTNGDSLQKIKTLSTRLEKFYIEDDYLYYAKIGDITGISKLSLSNGEEAMITSANINDFILEKDKIYFTDNVGFLYSVSTSGMDKKTISKGYGINKIQKKGKWIYFYDANEKALCRIKKDGDSKSTVATFVTNENFNVTNKYIYYLDKVNGQICRCDLKGKQSKAIVSIDTGMTAINIVNGTMYYLDKSQDTSKIYQMYRVKTNGKATAEIKY